MIRDALGIESDELLPDDLAQRPRAARPLHRRMAQDRGLLSRVVTEPYRFPPPWSVEELAAMSDIQPMTPEQAATLKRLAKDAYERDAYKPNLTRAEADLRIKMLTAKLKLLDGPPHTL
jgi:hypothetical protein